MGTSSTYIKPSISLYKSCNLQYRNQFPEAKKKVTVTHVQFKQNCNFSCQVNKSFISNVNFIGIFKNTKTFCHGEQGKRPGFDNRGQREMDVKST